MAPNLPSERRSSSSSRRPRSTKIDVALVRGAVFFIGMSLWGSKCVTSMQRYSPMTILPTFVQALQCKNHIVTYEVTLAVRHSFLL